MRHAVPRQTSSRRGALKGPKDAYVVAASSTPPCCDILDSDMLVRPTRPGHRAESPQTLLPKRKLAIGDAIDDFNVVPAIAQVTQVCEEAQLDWKTVASSDHVGTTWFMRRHGARTVHLQDLQEYRVASWIWEGHARLIIESDGEPAILSLVPAVRDRSRCGWKGGPDCVPDFAQELTRVQWSC